MSQEIVVCNSAVSAVVTWSLPCTATRTSSVGGAPAAKYPLKPSNSTAETTDHLTTNDGQLFSPQNCVYFLDTMKELSKLTEFQFEAPSPLPWQLMLQSPDRSWTLELCNEQS